MIFDLVICFRLEIMSGVATQPPPGPQEPPPTNGGPGTDGLHETNGPPTQVNGPPGPPGPPAGRGGVSPANAMQIQKMLDENSSLISTISEYQKMGRHNETMSYQVGDDFLGSSSNYQIASYQNSSP